MPDSAAPTDATATPDHLNFDKWLEAIDTLRDNEMDFKSILANHKALYRAGSKELRTDFKACLDEIGFDEKWEQYASEGLVKTALRPNFDLKPDLKAHLEAIGFEEAVQAVERFENELKENGPEHATPPSQKHCAEIAIGYLSSIMGAKGPFSCALLAWLVQEPERLLPGYYTNADGSEKSYDQLRGDLAEHFGQALVHGDAHQSLQDALEGVIPAGTDKLRMSSQFNNNKPVYLVKSEKEAGWVELPKEKLVEMMENPNGPKVVITSNHAFHETRPDLTAVTDNVERLTNASITAIRGPYEAIEEGDLPDHTATIDKEGGLDKDDILTVCVSHTRENNFLNLAQLFQRLDEVEQHYGQPENDPMNSVASTSRMVCETILQTIVEPADRNKVSLRQDMNGSWELFDHDNPPRLRDDAAEIIRQSTFVGFSQGGNMMRDGMRFLTRELEELAPLAEAEQGIGPDIRNILGAINMTVMSCNVKAMDDFYRERGVYVPILSNKSDGIAPPPAFKHATDDPRFDFDGFTDFSGHHPEMKIEGILKDDDTRRYFRGVFADSAQASAISMADIHNGVIYFEKAPGTDPKLFESELKEMLDPQDRTQRIGQHAYTVERAGQIGIGDCADFEGPKGRVVYAIKPKNDDLPIEVQLQELENLTFDHHRIARDQREGKETAHPPIHLVYGSHIADILHDLNTMMRQQKHMGIEEPVTAYGRQEAIRRAENAQEARGMKKSDVQKLSDSSPYANVDAQYLERVGPLQRVPAESRGAV